MKKMIQKITTGKRYFFSYHGEMRISALGQLYWIRPKFYLTCIKVLSHVITVPNMKEINKFMSEIWLQNGSHMFKYGKYANWLCVGHIGSDQNFT